MKRLVPGYSRYGPLLYEHGWLMAGISSLRTAKYSVVCLNTSLPSLCGLRGLRTLVLFHLFWELLAVALLSLVRALQLTTLAIQLP